MPPIQGAAALRLESYGEAIRTRTHQNIKNMIHELKKLKEFKIEIEGKETTLFAIPGKDKHGTLQIIVYTPCSTKKDGTYFGTLTKDLGAPEQSDTMAYVKTYTENESWAKQLADMIGKETGKIKKTGFVELPLYEFEIEKCYSDEEDNPEGKTFFELLRELGEWKPENEFVTTEAEAAFIERHFGLDKRKVMDLKNLRDMTVCYYMTIMEYKKSDSFAHLAMMSITAVIDRHIQK